MKFNVNDYVRVRLTDAGRAILALGDPLGVSPQEDAEGWSRWLLWDLANKFGGHLGLGRPAPFSAEIDFLGEEAREHPNASLKEIGVVFHRPPGLGWKYWMDNPPPNRDEEIEAWRAEWGAAPLTIVPRQQPRWWNVAGVYWRPVAR